MKITWIHRVVEFEYRVPTPSLPGSLNTDQVTNLEGGKRSKSLNTLSNTTLPENEATKVDGPVDSDL